jgi:hypothetical protein
MSISFRRAAKLGIEPELLAGTTGTSARRKAHGRVPGRDMNRTERAYQQHLQEQAATGAVVWFDFEPIRLRLGDNTFYVPDYFVLLESGELQCHEVKGRKGGEFYSAEKGWMKAKIAAATFPFAVLLVWPRKGGGWDSRVI